MAPPGRRRSSLFVMLLTILLPLSLFTTAVSGASSAVLGVDLGTEYLKAALVKPGIPLEIVLTKDSKRKETSAVAFKPVKGSSLSETFPERVYGGDAMALAARFPSDVYPNLKHLLGNVVAGNEVVREYTLRHPGLNLVELPRSNGHAMLGFSSASFDPLTEPFTVEELLAMQLQNIRANAETMAGEGTSIQNVVITVPAFYTAEEKQAVESAAELAGMRVLALVSDGLSVGLNYATSRTFPSINEGGQPEFHLVFDVGAGSTVATVLKFQGRTVKDVGRFNKTIQEVNVLGQGWDRNFGGDLLNGLIMDHMADEFVASPNVRRLGSITREAVLSHPRTAAKMWKESERIRQVLSANTETSASFEGLYYEDVNFKYTVTRAQFEDLAAPYTERIATVLNQALSMANLSITSLDSVVLHGGGSRTPLIQRMLENHVEAEKIRTNVNADEAAVFGAAFRGAGLSPSFRVKDIRATDISTYGVELQWTFDGKERQQKLFTPTSQVGAEKKVPFKNLDDFAFQLNQMVGPGDSLGRHGAAAVLEVQTNNLTASVSKLKDRFGCKNGDISTNFLIRLNSVDGLPEVVQGTVSCEAEKKGGVVDDVKGFFGFGGKKDDGAPLEEDGPEDKSLSAETVEVSPTTTTGTETALSGAKTSSEAESKRHTEVIFVDFSTKTKILSKIPEADMKRIRQRLAAFDASDISRRQREEFLNTLEAFTYHARDFLDDEKAISVSTEVERMKIQTRVKEVSAWLYEEGADAPTEEFKSKLSELTKLVDPIKKRKEEAVKRPEQIRLLKDTLDQTKTLVSVVKEQAEQAVSSASLWSKTSSDSTATSIPSSDDDFASLDDDEMETSSASSAKARASPDVPYIPSYTMEDADAILSVYESISAWLSEKLAKQDVLAPHEDPILLSTDIEAKAKELQAVVMDMLQKRVSRSPKNAKSTSKPKKSATRSSKASKKSSTSTASQEVESETPAVEIDEDMLSEEEIAEKIRGREKELHDEL